MSLIPLWQGFAYKAHQIIGINWMMNRDGGMLCDEMGLGKTIQMVGLLKNGVNTSKRSLLVAPVAVLEQWATVVKKSGMNVVRPVGARWGAEMGDVKLYMISYEMAVRHPQMLTTYAWDRAIWDEAHRLGSGNKSTEVAISVKADAKWLLTGTPVVNRIKDLINLFKVLGIRIYGTLDDIAPVIKERVMARTMDQLRASIPDAPPRPVYHTASLDFSTEDEAEFYKCMTGAIRKRWAAIGADGAMEKLRLFMRLRQLSLHPQIYIAGRKKALGALYTRDDWTATSTKFEAIKSMVTKGRWIIFCHFHKEMEMLQELLQPMMVQVYSGALNAAEKEAVLAATHGPENQVLLVQLQSGGVGLNLQHFNNIIFTGPWWTQALVDQAVGRAVRIGQHDVVQVHNIVLKEEETMNIDTYMNDKASEKGDLCKRILQFATSVIS